jgi:DEAD/DEAH box helicase
MWTCGACTFQNVNDAGTAGGCCCEICETPRGAGGGRSDRTDNDEDRAVRDGKGESNRSRVESSGVSGSALPQTGDAKTAGLSSHQRQVPSNQRSAAAAATTTNNNKPPSRGGGNLVQRTLMGTRAVPPVSKPTKKSSNAGKKRSRTDADAEDPPPDDVAAKKDAPSSCSARQGESRALESVAASSLNVPSSTTGLPSNYFDMERKQQRAKDVMARVFGVSKLRGLQPAAVQCAFEGRSQIVVMATGAGKSLCYQLPALVLGGTTIVVSPLIALMEDQVQALLSKGVAAAVLASSKSDAHNRTVLERLVGRPMLQSQPKKQLQQTKITTKSGTHEKPALPPLALVYCTPEQVQRTQFRAILHELYKNSLERNNDGSNNQRRPKSSHQHYLSLIAIDEAHCVSTWGHDFRPAYRNLEWIATALPRVPVIACTATATKQVLQDISQCLGMSPQSSKLHVGCLDRTNVFYRVAHVNALQFRHEQRSAPAQFRGTVEDPIRKHLLSHINKMHAQSHEQNLKCAGIIYCRKREHTIELTNWINQQHKKPRETHKQSSVHLGSASRTTDIRPIRAVAYHGGLAVKDRNAAQEGWTSGEYQVVVATSAFGA